MLTHPMVDQMQTLGLAGMAGAYRDLAEQIGRDGLSRDEWLEPMPARKMSTRSDKRLANRLAAARLRFGDACIENIDFAAHRKLDRRNVLALAQGDWLKALEHLIITGPTDPTT
jgi:DNA replication protein DnaC